MIHIYYVSIRRKPILDKRMVNRAIAAVQQRLRCGSKPMEQVVSHAALRMPAAPAQGRP
ncbi:hypothetical protein [Sphingomonas taxi]|jgi:hypothetical protein|uniref:hypothetical protein n=1 Tax=Sphingomonas taxi TaxID=1549858 RepID=UPI0012E015EF|nr:hypothetical protein [Sphingomonas taxi]